MIAKRIRKGTLRLPGALLFTWVLVLPTAAQAGPYFCLLASAPGVTLAYDPLSTLPLTASGSVTINCTKSGAGSSTAYYELGSNAGINLSGAQSRVVSGTDAINYGLATDSSRATRWTDVSSNRIRGSLNGTTSKSVTLNYYLLFPARQIAAGGRYTDTQTINLYQGSSASLARNAHSSDSITTTLAVSVAAQCTLSSAPGNLQFNYTSFQTNPATANTAFAVTCNSGIPYTMALDATSGTLLGLAYSLALSKTGTQTGNGTAQSAAINGTMPSGQAGTCSVGNCATSEARTLTISY